MSTTPPLEPPWVLWRQDDNGNRFVVATFDDQKAAEAALRAFERKKHKQTYWIDRAPDSPSDPTPE